MRPMLVRWLTRKFDADGTPSEWWSIGRAPDAPGNEAIVLLAIRHSASVRLTYPDGTAQEWAVEGVEDVGPNEPRSRRY